MGPCYMIICLKVCQYILLYPICYSNCSYENYNEIVAMNGNISLKIYRFVHTSCICFKQFHRHLVSGCPYVIMTHKLTESSRVLPTYNTKTLS